jgi:hypothetical protein
VLLLSCIAIVLADTNQAQDPALDNGASAPGSWIIIHNTPDLPASVQRIESCQNTSVQEIVPNYATCSSNTPVTTCSDAPTNASCITTFVARPYPCINGTSTITTTKTSCSTNGYVINNVVTLNTTGYGCSATDNGKVYVTCDSNTDGNGDGICTSGESCVQFGIVGTFVTTQERDSQDQWVDNDPSFGIAPATVVAS